MTTYKMTVPKMDVLPNKTTKRALIYCRVSSRKQVLEGHGLDSQEKLCRNYCEQQGYDVVAVFPDEGVSGGLFDRPAMKRLIEYLDNHPTKNFIVIFDDLKRFARDTKIHFELKSRICGRGSTVESPNFKFDNSPEGKFVETVMAAQAELERNQNRRQVIQKQRARLERGYWPFDYPPALKNIKDPVHGKLLVYNEPYATIFKQAIEEYRDDLIITLEDVRNFINNEYLKQNISEKISIHGVHSLLTCILYAGYIEYPKWEVSRRQGHHKGFITIETFNEVQDKLFNRSKKRKRKDYNLDFPLRGPVHCGYCNDPMTASWSTGRSKRYAKYWCKKKGCKYRWRGIRREKIEEEFLLLLDNIKPTGNAINMSNAIFVDIWKNRVKNEDKLKKVILSKIDIVDKDIVNLTKRLGKTDDDSLATLLEQELKKRIAEKTQYEKDSKTLNYTNENFGTVSNIVLSYIGNPRVMWKSKKYDIQRMLLDMYFNNKLEYYYETGFGTVDLAYPIKLIKQLEDPKSSLVEMGGIAPPSKRFSLKSSTGLAK